jgi:hypothetical protein
MFSCTITTHRVNTRARQTLVVRIARYTENYEFRDANIGPKQGLVSSQSRIIAR